MKRPQAVDPKLIFQSPNMLLAFGFGSGLSPVIPGTMGTLAAVPFYLLLVQLPWFGYAALVIAAMIWGNYLCGYAAKKLGVHDHSGIVWDEFVGLWITLFLIPLSWQNVLLGFALFRFFDMVKPWPISWVDKHAKGGFGIMVDDVIAGAAAWLCLQAWLVYF